MVIRSFFASAVCIFRVAVWSIFRWRRFGCFMVEPPKLSPFSRADDSDLVPAPGKACCENAACRDSANPVHPFFACRVFRIDELKPVRIQKRFHGFRETEVVLPDVLDFFFEVPFELHCADYTIPSRSRTRQEQTGRNTYGGGASLEQCPEFFNRQTNLANDVAQRTFYQHRCDAGR